MDRELADVVDVQLSFLEGELPTCWPNQDALPNRLEGGQAIIEVANIEAKRRVRPNEKAAKGDSKWAGVSSLFWLRGISTRAMSRRDRQGVPILADAVLFDPVPLRCSIG
jgi:hypothetical protein